MNFVIDPAQKPPHLNRRDTLQIVGATVALATAAGGLTMERSALGCASWPLYADASAIAASTSCLTAKACT